jgi:hypothetical protein
LCIFGGREIAHLKDLELQKDIFENPNKEKSKCLLEAL